MEAIQITYGLIGYPLSHSFSQKYFNEKFEKENIKNAEYKNFEIADIELLHKVVSENPNLRGLSVTIPHKESIITFLDELDETAQNIGAVNCVKIVRESLKVKLKGYNTDFYGFTASLQEIMTGKETTALIFGSGGAAKAVAYALKQLKIQYKIVSRQLNTNPDIIKYDELSEELISETDILINTTPLGMWPNVNEAIDIPYEHIKHKSIAFDLTYNPKKTLFLKKAEEYGSVICNGLRMLELQADEALNIFNK